MGCDDGYKCRITRNEFMVMLSAWIQLININGIRTYIHAYLHENCSSSFAYLFSHKFELCDRKEEERKRENRRIERLSMWLMRIGLVLGSCISEVSLWLSKFWCTQALTRSLPIAPHNSNRFIFNICDDFTEAVSTLSISLARSRSSHTYDR